MCAGPRRASSIALVAIALLLCGLCSQAFADSAGTVHFVRSADSSFDQFTSSPSTEAQAWINSHMWRMMVWSPYFDQRTGWYTRGWLYQDAYAIYKGSPLATQHPEWILRDSAQNKLFIPWGCSGGSCPQYAGDISNPAFRRYWIEETRAHLAHGYRGLFVDDVNMEERTGDGEEHQVLPVGLAGPISAPAWRAYMAEFMAEVRAAFPSAEIVHNALWFANNDAGPSDPSIRRQIESANYILLERGVNDSGLTGGSGPWSLSAFFSFIDAVHSLGRGVVLDGAAGDPQGMEYNLASYFLLSTGSDAVSGRGQTPENWWSGFDVNLGEAVDGRYGWSNVLRRDFSAGMVLVNPPGAATQTISLPNPMQDTSGHQVTSVTLPAGSGAVLRGNAPLPGPLIAQGSSSASPTQTLVEAAAIPARPAAGPAGSPASFGHGATPASARPAAAQERRSSHRRAHARRSGGGARITGLVRQATQGTVTITVERLRGKRWVAAMRLSASVDSAGRFMRTLKLGGGGRYRVRASYAGTSTYQPSQSGYRTLVLRVG